MLPARSDYGALRRDFRWVVPQRFNMAAACLSAAHDATGAAIIHQRDDGVVETWRRIDLDRAARRLANALAARGQERGDRLAILLPQSPQTAIAHLAAWRNGAITVPLSILFGTEALAYRLDDSGARLLVTNVAGAAKVADIDDRPASLARIVSIDGGSDGRLADGGDQPIPIDDWDTLLAAASESHRIVDTGADDPAVMVYTSGTTGPPKGALHAHRILIGHLPGVQMSHEFLPQPGDLMWTPADWAWAGGLFNVLLPGLYFNLPVVAHAGRFDPQVALDLMARHKVRNAFLPPTAVRMLMTAGGLKVPSELDLRTVGSGGETLGREAGDWGRRMLGLTINEFYGQTECNYVVSSCGAIGVSRPGAIGRPVPGHDVRVIDGAGNEVPPGEQGEIAVAAPDPVMFLRYWGHEQATEQKFVGNWMKTGDQGVVDEDGYLHFVGRDDDVITSAGFRIGPGEIEDCLAGHPAVRLAVVVGKPDPLRTEIVKAFVVPRSKAEASPALAEAISRYVRERLSAHEYPREIEFVDDIPLTTTGKVIRRHFRAAAAAEAAAETAALNATGDD